MMVWNTSAGTRTLIGPEADLFREILDHLVEEIMWGEPYPVGIRLWDSLTAGQQLALLEEVATALLLEEHPAPELTAVRESAVGAIYTVLQHEVTFEIETDLSPEFQTAWRQLIIAASADTKVADADELPEPTSDDISEWEILVEYLKDSILWDEDYAMDDLLMDDAPEHSAMLRDSLNITDDYFTAISPDPTDAEIEEIVERLRKLSR